MKSIARVSRVFAEERRIQSNIRLTEASACIPEKLNLNVFNPLVDKVGKVIVESLRPVTLFNSRKINLGRRGRVGKLF